MAAGNACPSPAHPACGHRTERLDLERDSDRTAVYRDRTDRRLNARGPDQLQITEMPCEGDLPGVSRSSIYDMRA